MQDPRNANRWLATAEIKDYRTELFHKQSGYCHWCNGCMKLIDYNNRTIRIEGNVATFEHLRDRFSSGGRKGSENDIVLACAKCNNDRNRMREVLVREATQTHLGPAWTTGRGIKISEIIEKLNELGVNPLLDDSLHPMVRD